MRYAPIIGTLAYVWDRDADAVLMVKREGRPDDEHRGKYNGLGGKLEPRESVAAGVRRELWEEARINLLSLRLRGTVNWPGFGANGEDWLGFVFLCDRWEGETLDANEEGSLHWIPRDRLLAACAPQETVRRAAELPMDSRSTGAWKISATSLAMPLFWEAPPVRRMRSAFKPIHCEWRRMLRN